jgi:hypothetical protein
MTYQVGDAAAQSFLTPPAVATTPPANSAVYSFQLTATDIPASNTYLVTISAWDQTGAGQFAFNVQAVNANPGGLAGPSTPPAQPQNPPGGTP